MICCLAVWASAARADGVLLRQTAGLRDGLCAALRIQLTGAADVRCEPEPPGAPLSARIAAASARTAAIGASLGVLLERDPDPRMVRMYLIGADPAQAVIALERIEDRPDADVDRSLALEVQSALLALASAPPAPDAAPPPLVRVLTRPPPPPPPRLRWLLAAEAGAVLSVGTLVRYGGVAALGARAERGARYAELVATGRMLSRAEARANGATVEVEEWGAALALRAGKAFRWLSLGGLLAAGVERVHARGRAADGSVGGVRLAVPQLALGLDLRVRLARGAALRLAPALELYPMQHRFAVDGRVLESLGRARLGLPLSLIVTLPFERGDTDHAP